MTYEDVEKLKKQLKIYMKINIGHDNFIFILN